MARLKGFERLTSIDMALAKLFGVVGHETNEPLLVPIGEARRRVMARDVVSAGPLPSSHRSAMDGYALKAEGTVGASQSEPRSLRLVDREPLGEGEAKQIWTGNQLPEGADSVVKLERTRKVGRRIKVLIPIPPGTNVSKKGEDVKQGEVVVKMGVRLTSRHLGLLAALGMKEVEVVKMPKIAILVTGDEIAGANGPLGPDQVVDANTTILSNMCAELGAEALSLGVTKDDEDAIEKGIRQGLAEADIVITTGGTSVGAHDLVPVVVERMEHHSIIAHGIAMRPGMPTALAVVSGKPVIMLSGNPVAAVVGFEALILPLILNLLGVKETRVKLTAKLTRRVAGTLGSRVFLRVKVVENEGELQAEPIRVKGSGIITTMTKANGYVVIPEDREGLMENELVRVVLFDMLMES
ncbi:MAG: molybdopterin molybdotransferase MoeA [Candidatus Bathyarchaeota archaeon]|nr:molybdopterin molybdotransferase MoeA [Candidatus Bathyarchaeota archaeon]